MIRRASVNDALNIFNVGDSIFENFLSADFIKEELQNNNSFWFVAEKENKIVGFVGARIYDNTDILDIGVINEYREQGIASKLLEEILKVKNGVVTLEVRVNNTKAIHLYEKYGFQVFLLRKKYYSNGDDAYFMIKE